MDINETRLNVRVKGPMADHVNGLIGPQGLYENQSEYVRELIRQDMKADQSDSLNFYKTMMESLESPTQELEKDYIDKKRAMLKKLQATKTVDTL